MCVIAALPAVASVAGMAGQVMQGRAAAATAGLQVRQIERQREEEKYLATTREERARAGFRSQIARQRAQIAGRGVSLASPTAVLLGEDAAREMSYEAQSIRAQGQATQSELSGQQQLLKARGRQALLGGHASAAGTLLNAAPDLWPELLG